MLFQARTLGVTACVRRQKGAHRDADHMIDPLVGRRAAEVEHERLEHAIVMKKPSQAAPAGGGIEVSESVVLALHAAAPHSRQQVPP